MPELHAIFMRPRDDDGGVRSCVTFLVPEATRQQLFAGLRIARATKARVLIVTDTREQADRAAKRAARMLPEHVRVPDERAEAGWWGRLA
jgi:hypothetical protein